MVANEIYDAVKWTPELMYEVVLPDPDAFLKIKETLTRIGIASKRSNILYPSCNILHKRGRYFIVHFKELFALDGKNADLDSSDLARRDTIAALLTQWGLCKPAGVRAEMPLEVFKKNMMQIKVVSYADKKNWTISPKFKMLSDRIRQTEVGNSM